jgi:hypothetical protein
MLFFMKRATATHFINKSLNSVLLAYQQKKVIGLKGYGGKIEEGETPQDSVTREVFEEAGGGIIFDPADLVPVGLIDFYNGTEEEVPLGNPSFRVLFYNCYKFRGNAVSTEEMKDPWFYLFDSIPIEELVKGDELFLLSLLREELTKGWIRRTTDFRTVLGSHFEPATIEDLII